MSQPEANSALEAKQQNREVSHSKQQWASDPEKFTDIAAIRPIDAPIEEEKKGSSHNFPNNISQSGNTGHPLESLAPKESIDVSQCQPDTKVSPGHDPLLLGRQRAFASLGEPLK